MGSQGFHLPSRILQSPTARSHFSRDSPPQDVELSELESPVRSPASTSNQTFHTPRQDSLAHLPAPPARHNSPRPLQLLSSNFQTQQKDTPLNGLLPSALPHDNPFSDVKVPLTSPAPGMASAFDSTPPVSPAETMQVKKSRQGNKGPKPLYNPTVRLLFSLSDTRDKITLLLPAAIFSLAAGIVPPLMTIVLGDAFDIFATYQQALADPQADLARAGQTMKHDMTWIAVKLIILGILAVAFMTAALAIWLIHGERVAMRLRRIVYLGIVNKSMAWFDTGMGKRTTFKSDDEQAETESDMENESSGGLMGRFAREIDAARYAVVSEVGRILTAVCTIVACLVVAFWHSYALTLVILGMVPIIVIITVVIEVMVQPLMVVEKNVTASASGRVERATSAISTVKAFNAEESEAAGYITLADKSRMLYNRITLLWGFRAGFVQFLLLAMFVVGFWFGNWLVVTGRKSAGNVTIVFWASLLASSNMQMILPMLNLLDKGKVAMASLLETAHAEPESQSRPNSAAEEVKFVITDKLDHDIDDDSANASPASQGPPSFRAVQPETSSRTRRHSPPTKDIKKIQPKRFMGELVLKDVTFHYPSRPAPAAPALEKVSLFLPARETTYIVGGSGSGKSTVGSLLLGLYAPEAGSVEADEQEIRWLDEKWLRAHIGMVSQGASVIFDGTVHENVALGVIGAPESRKRALESVTRREVVDACKAALFHDFVTQLPDGYHTILSGERGASLSGGQRQKLALARAFLRDPTVMILDEATSALDILSRSLVHDAIKKRRKNKTTIIITHDLSPITSDDYVYVMKDGTVAEQGYRYDLEAKFGGWFRELAHLQSKVNMDAANPDMAEEVLDLPDVMVTPPQPAAPAFLRRLSASPGNLGSDLRSLQETRRLSQTFLEEQKERRLSSTSPVPSFRTASPHVLRSPPRTDSIPHASRSQTPSRGDMRRSGQFFTPGEASLRPRYSERHPSRQSLFADTAISTKRLSLASNRMTGPRSSWHQLTEVVTDTDGHLRNEVNESNADIAQIPPPSLMQIWKTVIPMIPNKVGLAIGLLFCVGAGICTPMFSNLFSQLISALGDPGSINLTRTALLLLLIALLSGLTDWGKYSLLQRVAMEWVLHMQEKSYSNIIHQDKRWFDQAENAPINMVSLLIKDAEDARNLIGYIVGNIFVIITMVSIGLIWAFVKGWQLTLVGLAMGPIFIISASAETQILGKYERANKKEREECAKRFYQSVSNIKAIRSMSLEPVFYEKFEASIQTAYKGGKKSAFFTGFGSGIAYFTIYVTEAVMFLVGAIFITKGWYSLQQVLAVFVFLIFTVTFSTQVLQNIPQIAKAKYAVVDLLRVYRLSIQTKESQGKTVFPINGQIQFRNVTFSYPSRPEATVLEDVSFDIKRGECVGIVGPSGSGKSTIAALLQRLYEPEFGLIRMDDRDLSKVDVRYLRDHVAVVSQHPALFDMSIEDNIKYGSPDISFDNVVRAAKMAHLHDFVMSLPDGYKTSLGENASLISGGQAQRLQIARALVKDREILLGDEITSALDAENQELVMKTIADVKHGRTTILITHKVSVMKTCDRLIVMENGRVVQQGRFEDLLAQKGSVFARLASGGELEHV